MSNTFYTVAGGIALVSGLFLANIAFGIPIAIIGGLTLAYGLFGFVRPSLGA